ncbi:MAG: diguanylate cyclase [Chloroflexota bacterium]
MDYRQQLSDFASRIQDIFGLQEQGNQLVTLIADAFGCEWVCLLFLDTDDDDYTSLSYKCGSKSSFLTNLKIRRQDPLIDYLNREKKPLTSETLATLPQLRVFRETHPPEFNLGEVALLLPIISREQLIGILVIAKKQSGKYLPEDFRFLKSIVDRSATGMEKEYLREQLARQSENLSVINRCNTIITSTLDIQKVFGSLIAELGRVVDVNWAGVVLLKSNRPYFLALSANSIWKVGEEVPVKGTATEWITTHKKAHVEIDLSQGSQFISSKAFVKQGIHSLVYLPLMAKDRVTGNLIVGSLSPNTYSKSKVTLLEQLASQIAMHIENARLYTEVEEKARIDDLTGLLNRRSLDETIVNEINRHLRYGGVFSLIILDLDRFKAFNDHHGHLVGDKLLAEIGDAIKRTIRSADLAFRYGGDEFAILLPNTPIAAAKAVAERVRKQIASKMIVGNMTTASLGLASWPANGKGMEEIIAVADTALYHAKRNGGNQSYCAQ